MTNRLERIGKDKTWIQVVLEPERLKEYLKLRKEKDVDLAVVREELISIASNCARGYFSLEDTKKCRSMAESVVEYADDYFFGDWRDLEPDQFPPVKPPFRKYWLYNLSWNYEFQPAYVWGSALGDWKFLKKLGGFFPDDLRLNVDQTPSNHAWMLIVAGVIRGRDWKEMKAFRETIENSKARGKREQLLLAILDAILHGTDQQLESAASEYFKYFRKSDVKQIGSFTPLMSDGSFLIHFAKKQKRKIAVPEEIADYFITF
jgi:hypothetical protein